MLILISRFSPLAVAMFIFITGLRSHFVWLNCAWRAIRGVCVMRLVLAAMHGTYALVYGSLFAVRCFLENQHAKSWNISANWTQFVVLAYRMLHFILYFWLQGKVARNWRQYSWRLVSWKYLPRLAGSPGNLPAKGNKEKGYYYYCSDWVMISLICW